MKAQHPVRSRAQALVEFALIFGVIVLVAIASLQFFYAFYVTRNVGAAAEDIADVAAVHGGDTSQVQERIPGILQIYRLDPAGTTVTITPAQAGFQQALTVTVNCGYNIPIVGLFNLPIAPQTARALSQKDWNW